MFGHEFKYEGYATADKYEIGERILSRVLLKRSLLTQRMRTNVADAFATFASPPALVGSKSSEIFRLTIMKPRSTVFGGRPKMHA